MKTLSSEKNVVNIKTSSVSKKLFPVEDPADCHVGAIVRALDGCYRLVEVKSELVAGVKVYNVYGKAVTVK